MCVNCQLYNYVCQECGTILDDRYAHLQPYEIDRKSIKNIIWSSQADTFVWFLRFKGQIVKVGFGNLLKLLNETRPNANYIRFDSVFIYYCTDARERDQFACCSMGEIEGVINRRGVKNDRYKTKKEMRWSSVISAETRAMLLGDPEFKIGDNEYYDLDRLVEYGVH